MTQIKLRRDTAANFTSKNPVLGVGEPAYETDTKKLKIGDGTTAYNSLGYFSMTDEFATYREKYGAPSDSVPVVNTGNSITIKAGVSIETPNGTLTNATDMTYTYDFSTDRVLFVTENDYYNAYAVYYGGREPSPVGEQIFWFNNNVWTMISGNGTKTVFNTQKITPIAKIYQVNGTVKNIDYSSYTKTSAGGSANISATLPLKIVDGVISLEVDGQTIQIVDGKLHANLDELNNPFSLFDSKYSDHELNNLSWLKSEGQWNAKAVYTDAYGKLLKVHNGTETVEGLSVKLSTETYTDYDFVLNTADETFRLPLKSKLASGKTVVGNGMTLGLTNGVSNFAPQLRVQQGVYGGTEAGFGVNVGTELEAGNAPADLKAIGVTTDPTKSGIETSDRDLYLYYYVGETVQNVNLIDAGRIGEELVNIKASIDGDWTYKSLTFADSFSLPINTEGAGGVFTYDLSNYLPNDGYKYEVTISVEVNNSSFCTLGYYLPDNSWYSFAKGGNPTGGCFTAIVDSSRQVKISVVNTQEALMWANAAAYRRLGKKV